MLNSNPLTKAQFVMSGVMDMENNVIVYAKDWELDYSIFKDGSLKDLEVAEDDLYSEYLDNMSLTEGY